MDTLRLTSSLKDLKSRNLWLSLIGEFIGTFILVFIGFGSTFDNKNPVKIGLGFGLAGVISIYCVGPISGGHINPAVSIGVLIARHISLIRFVLYSLTQIIASVMGFNLIYLLTNGNILKKFSSMAVVQSNQSGRIMGEVVDRHHQVHGSFLKVVCEMVITFSLVFTVMRMCFERTRTNTEKGVAPFVIGMSIAIGVYCGMNISGGSMNPAASLAKYFTTGDKDVWVHIVGPLLGGIIAGLMQQLVFTSELSVKHVRNYLFSKTFPIDDADPPDQEKNLALKHTEVNEPVKQLSSEKEEKDQLS